MQQHRKKNDDDEISLSNYQEARFVCKGAVFTINFQPDQLKLKYIQPVERGLTLSKPLVGDQSIEFQQIIGTQSMEQQRRGGGAATFELKKVDPSKQYALIIHYYVKKSGGLWKRRSLCLHSQSQLMASHLAILINKRRDEYLLRHNQSRPKRLLVFVNPYGGRKKARPVYTSVVAPLFELAGIHCDVTYTKHQNHARNHVENEDLSSYDGIVAVGGDGIASEIVNGILYKTQRDNDIALDVTSEQLCDGFHYRKPPIRIGIIPAGSTNALVYTMQGCDDAETAAIHIVVGDGHPLDVCSIHQHDGKLLKYSFAMTSYGFYGNLLRESEQMRRLGPVRYDLAGVKTFLQLHSHEAEISYLPSYQPHDVATDNSRCRYPCRVCLHGDHNKQHHVTAAASDEDDLKRSVGSSGNDITSGYVTSTVASSSASSSLSSSSDLRPGWKVERGKFTVVSSSLMSCACRKSPIGLSPSAHLADGNTDLILVKRCSKLDFFRYLTTHIGNGDRFNFSFVDVKRVQAIKYKSLASDTTISTPSSTSVESIRESEVESNTSPRGSSCWNTDGEFIENPDICLWVHRGLIDMFARGVEP